MRDNKLNISTANDINGMAVLFDFNAFMAKPVKKAQLKLVIGFSCTIPRGLSSEAVAKKTRLAVNKSTVASA